MTSDDAAWCSRRRSVWMTTWSWDLMAATPPLLVTPRLLMLLLLRLETQNDTGHRSMQKVRPRSAQAPTSIRQWWRTSPCEELDPATFFFVSPAINDTDGNAVRYHACFVQKITFVLRKINKNCRRQSCTFWFQYAPNPLSTGASPQTPVGELTALPQAP